MSVGLDHLTRLINVVWGGKYALFASTIGAPDPAPSTWDKRVALAAYNEITGENYQPWPDTRYPTVPSDFDAFKEAASDKWGRIFDRGGEFPNGFLLLNLQAGMKADDGYRVRITRSEYIGTGFPNPIDWLHFQYDDTDKKARIRGQYPDTGFDETQDWGPLVSWFDVPAGATFETAWMPPETITLRQAYNVIKTGFPD